MCHLLFLKNGDEKVFFNGFHFSERSKAVVLLDAFRRAPNQNPTSSIKDSLLLSQYQLNHKIGAYESQLNNERIKSQPNLDTVKTLLGKIINMRQADDSLNYKIGKLFPNFQRKNQIAQTPDITTIRKKLLGNSKTLIEYFLTDSTLYIFLINQQNIALEAVPINSDFKKHLKQLSTRLTIPKMKEETNEGFISFFQSASY